MTMYPTSSAISRASFLLGLIASVGLATAGCSDGGAIVKGPVSTANSDAGTADGDSTDDVQVDAVQVDAVTTDAGVAADAAGDHAGADSLAVTADDGAAEDINADVTADADAGFDGGSPCAAALDCDDGDVCTDDVCDAATGQCANLPISSCPASKSCAAATDCSSDVVCTIAACVAGQCQTFSAPDGVPCDDGSTCSKGTMCASGVCGGGAPVTCDDGNPCTDDTCQAGLGCLAVAGGKDCSDGDLCTEGDACAAGKCEAGAMKKACDDDNPCTEDACDAKTGCTHTNNTAVCDDGSACTTGDTCTAGVCKATKPAPCDDGNPCTTDSCDPKTGCKTASNTATCDDGDACTTKDACAAEVCTGGAKIVCDDNNSCTTDACVAKTGCTVSPVSGVVACSDGDVCTEGDACKGGACLGGSKTSCDDGQPCTIDSCDAKIGCVHKVSAGACDDGDVCTTGDVCKATKCTATGTKDCDDKNACTVDSCGASGCAHTNKLGACDDGDLCTFGDVCSGGTCGGGKAKNCNDGSPCTDDSCDGVKGCVNANNTATCNDGSACSTGDACKDGNCVAGKPAPCDDNNPCTTEDCDAQGGCKNRPNHGKCNDGDVCTVGDVCSGGKCQPGQGSSCDDGKVCTIDKCDPIKGCSFSAKTAACDDGNPCTQSDTCVAGLCKSGVLKVCDDGNSCTDDACDPTKGCVSKPGAVKTCDDGNLCTDETCDSKTGKCLTSNNVVACDSGDACTYGDTCFNGVCKTAATKKCDDGNDCTVDACDSKTGKCTAKSVADGGACSDGLLCTAGDTCKAGQCVASKVNCPLFTDGFDCGDAGAGWKLDKPAKKKVLWAVDASPTLPNQANYACTLNFNNGTNYCDAQGNGCQTPTGRARSPIIDATKAFGTARLTFDSFVQVDGGFTDRPRVVIRNADTGAQIQTFTMSKASNKMNVWRSISVQINAVVGVKFVLEFYLQTPSGYGANDGKGWAIDNIVVDQKPVAESCTDGIDNDGNGKVDCDDPACIAKGGCVELCGNGIDDDYNDKIDCDDAACKGTLDCAQPTLKWDFNCGDTGWTYSKGANNVSWNIDATPIAVKPYTGGCTLNYNNGSTYCGASNCSGKYNGSAGLATLNQVIDATAFKALKATYWAYVDVSSYGNLNTDNGYLQASTSNFVGCCGATNQCTSAEPNVCNKGGTQTFTVPEPANGAKKWAQVSVDLKSFVGKKFQLRFRFNSNGSGLNNYPGVFVDDLRIYGTK